MTTESFCILVIFFLAYLLARHLVDPGQRGGLAIGFILGWASTLAQVAWG